MLTSSQLSEVLLTDSEVYHAMRNIGYAEQSAEDAAKALAAQLNGVLSLRLQNAAEKIRQLEVSSNTYKMASNLSQKLVIKLSEEAVVLKQDIEKLKQGNQKLEAELQKCQERYNDISDTAIEYGKEIKQLKQGYGIPHERLLERLNDANNGDYVGTLLTSYYSSGDLVAELNRRGCRGIFLGVRKGPLTSEERQKFIEEYNIAKEKLDLPDLVPSAPTEALVQEIERREENLIGPGGLVPSSNHPYPKNDNLRDVINLLHYELCPTCMREVDTGYECTKCGKYYGEWFKLFSSVDVTGEQPSLLFQSTSTLTAEEREQLKKEWKELHNGPERIVPVLGPMTLDQYQKNALITEAPIDQERWEKAADPAMSNLIRVGYYMKELKLDATKKFAAYGTIPADLQIANINETKGPWPNSYKGLPIDMEVYRVLHALLGVITEGEELTEWLWKAITKAYDKVCDEGSHSGVPARLTLADFDIHNLKEEIGDHFWYFALLAEVFGFTLQECMELNEKKLQKVRYKLGKFTPEEAAKRDLEAERQVLEATDASVENLPPHCGTTTDLAERLTCVETNNGPAYIACQDCGKPMTFDGDIVWCPACEGEEVTLASTIPASSLVEREAIDNCALAVGSSKHNHVWQALKDIPASFPGEELVVAGNWYFLDEMGLRSGSYSTEDEAIKAIHAYIATLTGVIGKPVDESKEVCGFCGKTGHIILNCVDKEKMATSPEKLEQELVVVEPPAKKVFSPGDEFTSMRRSLKGYRFRFERIDTGDDNPGDWETYAICTITVVPNPDLNHFSIGQEIKLNCDELVPCK